MKSPSNASGSTLRELKPYPKMKDSGIGWLGEAPAHWEVTALRHRYDQCLGKMLDAKLITGQHLVPYLRNVDVQWDRINVSALPQIDIHPHEIERYTVRPGDLLACEGGEVGRCAIWEGAMEVCGYQKALHRLRPCLPERDRPRFLLYALRLAAERGAFNDGQESTIRHLTGEKLRAHRFAFPPAAEQHCIQAFLDHADRRIRGYIRAKEKLIALLEEQKQVIIHQAVTGQIDVRTGRPYRVYKPSGVEWLGRVPVDWEVIRLGRLIGLTVGFPFKSDGFTQSDGDMRLLRGVNIAPGRVRWEDVVRWAAGDVSRFAEYRLQVGDIVLGMDRPVIGGGIRVAAVAQSDVPSLLLQRVARIRPKQGLLGEFALRLLGGRRFSDYLAPIFTGVSVPHLSPEQVAAFPLALPSMSEQVRIVECLRSGVDVLHAAVEGAHDEIALIEEYRTRLISDVVTGKLDVRKAAAGLPEVDPLAAEDDSDDGSNPEAGSDGDEFGVSGQEVEA